jgi:hypothetical protein
MVRHPEGFGRGLVALAVADEVAINGSLLRLQVIAQHLVEALQANSISIFLFVFANLRSAPDTFHEVNVFSFCWYLAHRFLLAKRDRFGFP